MKTVKNNYRRNVVGLFALVTIIFCVAVFSGESRVVKADNSHSEQIVFSGTGFGTFGSVQSPLGFWVWCQNSTSGNGLYGRDKACQGAMYIYALGITKGVFGFGANGGVTENPQGIYTMHVHSADFAIDARLTNASSVLSSGPNNTVNLVYSTPGGSGSSTNSVVIVTGKE